MPSWLVPCVLPFRTLSAQTAPHDLYSVKRKTLPAPAEFGPSSSSSSSRHDRRQRAERHEHREDARRVEAVARHVPENVRSCVALARGVVDRQACRSHSFTNILEFYICIHCYIAIVRGPCSANNSMGNNLRMCTMSPVPRCKYTTSLPPTNTEDTRTTP